MEFKNKNKFYDDPKLSFLKEIWEYLNEDYSVEQMILASKIGKPALWAVYDYIKEILDTNNDIIENYTNSEGKLIPIKTQINQLIGVMIREIMIRNNFIVLKQDTLNNLLPFKSASIYIEDDKHKNIMTNLENSINNITNIFNNISTVDEKTIIIHYIERIILEYRLYYRDFDIEDNIRKEIKKHFIFFIVNFFQKIETSQTNNHINDGKTNFVLVSAISSILVKSLIENYNQNKNYEYSSDISKVINSIFNKINITQNMSNIEYIASNTLMYIQKSKILSDEEIEDIITPMLNRIKNK